MHICLLGRWLVGKRGGCWLLFWLLESENSPEGPCKHSSLATTRETGRVGESQTDPCCSVLILSSEGLSKQVSQVRAVVSARIIAIFWTSCQRVVLPPVARKCHFRITPTWGITWAASWTSNDRLRFGAHSQASSGCSRVTVVFKSTRFGVWLQWGKVVRRRQCVLRGERINALSLSVSDEFLLVHWRQLAPSQVGYVCLVPLPRRNGLQPCEL